MKIIRISTKEYRKKFVDGNGHELKSSLAEHLDKLCGFKTKLLKRQYDHQTEELVFYIEEKK